MIAFDVHLLSPDPPHCIYPLELDSVRLETSVFSSREGSLRATQFNSVRFKTSVLASIAYMPRSSAHIHLAYSRNFHDGLVEDHRRMLDPGVHEAPMKSR